MFYNIDNDLIEDAWRILTLLCFVVRLLKMQELVDDIVVEINSFTKFNRSRRLQDIDNIREICSSFIDIDLDVDYSNKNYYEVNSTLTVRIAHFSVQEYLKSERIRHQKTAIFSLNNVTTYVDICKDQ